MERKGQAAMEFLMTYGWAILAAIIAIGVLAYFGVFSPGKFVPSATVLSPPFYSTGSNVQTDGTIQIEVKNNGGETYILTGADISWTTGASGSCSNSSAIGTLIAGNSSVITFDCSSAFAGVSTGDAVKGDISVSYTASGSSLDRVSTGTIANTAN